MINSFPGLILAIETNAKTLTQTDFDQGFFFLEHFNYFNYLLEEKINNNVWFWLQVPIFNPKSVPKIRLTHLALSTQSYKFRF